MSENSNNREYVRVAECQEVFGLSRRTIYRLAKRGQLTIHKGTGVSLVRAKELRAAIEGEAA